MKRLFPLIAVCISLCLSSCLDSYSDFVPRVSTTQFVRYTWAEGDTIAKKDTLALHYNSNDNSYFLDSVNVGDTIRVTIAYQSFANFLVSTTVDWDSTKVSLTGEIPADYQKALLSTSNIHTLHLNYHEGYNLAGIPLTIVPLRSSDCRLTLGVTSDAKKVENSVEEHIYLYIK
ncbi:MAG: hypothetical protein IJS13_03500 [Paludibacteraceae bacterium]|nr:hypothetical protein [Paludibacteraceae bacterium]